MRQPTMGVEELTQFLDEVFPQVKGQMVVEAVAPMTARLRMPVDERHLRPGGTVSGPSMFTLADCAYYAATLAMIGRQALTVTTSLTINFLAKPPAADLVCEARILRLGRVLSVGEATIWSAARDDGPVAHAAVTYAIPPAKG
jgi:uncharacterized protein (TIGR00369 family)